MVFVDVSYRRGNLGFLALKSLAKRNYPQYSGNYGIGDVIAALKWINLNIQHFGGHPAKVTVLGRGFGATVATALTAAPSAKKLVQRVWATNGSPFADKTFDESNSDNKVRPISGCFEKVEKYLTCTSHTVRRGCSELLRRRGPLSEHCQRRRHFQRDARQLDRR